MGFVQVITRIVVTLLMFAPLADVRAQEVKTETAIDSAQASHEIAPSETVSAEEHVAPIAPADAAVTSAEPPLEPSRDAPQSEPVRVEPPQVESPAPLSRSTPIVPIACATASESCVTSCTRFDKKGDPRRLACENFCRKSPKVVSCEQRKDELRSAISSERRPPEVRKYAKKSEMLVQRELNATLLKSITDGNLSAIRRMIEMKGLNATYVYAYDFNAESRLFEGQPIRLRLTDLFNDANTLRNDKEGADKILALFLELGMDVTATLPKSVPSATASDGKITVERTAWGPSLTMMEKARDRDARLRAFNLALEKGLRPNDDIGDWLFLEFPQVCGRDRSQFAIQVMEVLIRNLGASLQGDFWRMGERGPETVADVLDRMISRAQPKTEYDKTQFALMDQMWENCGPLSRRINRYLMQGN